MIYLKNITKIYSFNRDKIVALDSINLSIKMGSAVVLKGVSGSGKSTLLSLIAGLSKPTSGEVVIDGSKISKLPDNFLADFRQKNIGFIFQKYHLISNLSVIDNIILPLIPLNENRQTIKDKIDKVLVQLKIADKSKQLVKNLSGGEQQRVAIARAMVNNPQIIIADEPTANLDKKLSLDFIEILSLLKQLNKTIIVASHDPLFFDLNIIDKVVEICGGKIEPNR